jgi:hypothetical protein
MAWLALLYLWVSLCFAALLADNEVPLWRSIVGGLLWPIVAAALVLAALDGVWRWLRGLRRALFAQGDGQKGTGK